MFRSLVGVAAALALAASTGSAFGAQIVFTPADFTTGTSVANLTGATVTSSPRPFDKKTIAGIEGLGVQGGFVDGEIDLSGPESITFTFANPTQLTDLQLAFLYKDGNFGDIVSEVARLVVTVAGVTGQFPGRRSQRHHPDHRHLRLFRPVGRPGRRRLADSGQPEPGVRTECRAVGHRQRLRQPADHVDNLPGSAGRRTAGGVLELRLCDRSGRGRGPRAGNHRSAGPWSARTGLAAAPDLVTSSAAAGSRETPRFPHRGWPTIPPANPPFLQYSFPATRPGLGRSLITPINHLNCDNYRVARI